MHPRIGFLAGTVLLLTASWGRADGESWPRFRGTHGAGVVAADHVPVRLAVETRAWSTPLPGPGTSSPVVWGGSVFVTAEDGEKGQVVFVCLDAVSGEVRWSRRVTVGDYHTHKMNNTAAATPCVSAEAVVFSWYDAEREVAVLTAFSHEGRKLWGYDVGRFRGSHGVNLHPVIHGNRVLIAHLHQDGGHVLALDAGTGRLVWKKDYPSPSRKTTYMTPLVRKRHSASGPEWEVVVAATSIGVRGLNFEDGTELWSLPGVFKERCIVSPVDVLAGSGSSHSLVTVGCKNNVFFALRPPEERGGQPEVVWRLEKNAPYVPTPVSDGQTLYVLSDGGVLQAVDPHTGAPRWQEKLPANFYASPLLIGGRLYGLSREGEMFVAEVRDGFKLLGTSDLEPGGEVTWSDATPAVAGGSLYVRIGARLDCYRSGK